MKADDATGSTFIFHSFRQFHVETRVKRTAKSKREKVNENKIKIQRCNKTGVKCR